MNIAMNDKREQIEGFTPGPWSATDLSDTPGYWAVYAGALCVADGCGEKDARLIALAPTLHAENESLRAEVARLREELKKSADTFADLYKGLRLLNHHVAAAACQIAENAARAALKVTPP